MIDARANGETTRSQRASVGKVKAPLKGVGKIPLVIWKGEKSFAPKGSEIDKQMI
jgi:hypothetical protein